MERERKRKISIEEFEFKKDNLFIFVECQGVSSIEGIYISVSIVDIFLVDNIVIEKFEGEIVFYLEILFIIDGQIVMFNSEGDVDYELIEIFNLENSIRKREEGSEEEKER